MIEERGLPSSLMGLFLGLLGLVSGCLLLPALGSSVRGCSGEEDRRTRNVRADEAAVVAGLQGV